MIMMMMIDLLFSIWLFYSFIIEFNLLMIYRRKIIFHYFHFIVLDWWLTFEE